MLPQGAGPRLQANTKPRTQKAGYIIFLAKLRTEFTSIALHMLTADNWLIRVCVNILVPGGRNPFGQHQEYRPLAYLNTGRPRLTDSFFSLTNLNGWKLQNEYSAHAKKLGTDQKSRFLVLTKRNAPSGDENGAPTKWQPFLYEGWMAMSS